MDLITLSFISLMGAMSPGPDFAIVTRFALTGCRKSAIYASLGITIAILFHLSYCFIGIKLLLQNQMLFSIIQVFGSLYLGYIGIKLLLAKKTKPNESPNLQKAFKTGFFTNLLNPKASLFFISIFSQAGAFGLSSNFLVVSSMIILLITFLWFSSLSFLITNRAFLPFFLKFQSILMKIMGIALLALAVSNLIF